MIRHIQTSDEPLVTQLLHEAFASSPFGYQGEGELVIALRQDVHYDPHLELVATQSDQLIGHVLLTPLTLEPSSTSRGYVLAPLAVHPDFQSRGVGQSLIEAIEGRAIKRGADFISILGDPGYYQRFGYLPADQFHIKSPFDETGEHHLIKELTPGALASVAGTIQYLPAFNEN